MKPVRFRQSGAVWVVALVATFGSVPVAATGPYLYWLPLLPLLGVVWGLRSGTVAGPDGITVRALLGSRHVAWDRIVAVGSPDGRRVLARLDNDTVLPLTAVTPADLPRLVGASGRAADPTAAGPDGPTAGPDHPAAGPHGPTPGPDHPAAGHGPTGGPPQ